MRYQSFAWLISMFAFGLLDQHYRASAFIVLSVSIMIIVFGGMWTELHREVRDVEDD